MKKNLEITLMSDLCAGVGKHFAATIDLDTATDEYGIPFIPSRRLKGCMREIAEMICVENIDAIFGKSGSNQPGSLFIGDARIENYCSAVKEIQAASNISPAVVTELFCSVRGETALEKGVAKDKSLRYIRVVNRISPIDSKPLKFVAEIDFDQDYEQDVANICSGLRSIGYHRNRGLGAVDCKLVDASSDVGLESVEFEDNTEYKFDYLVELQSDIMLPSDDSNHTLDYIPGTVVLGALASKYKGDDFNDVFLSGKVRFSNLYISDENKTDYVPAPGFLAKIKAPQMEEDKGVKNLVAENDFREKSVDVPQYKLLKKGYINSNNGYVKPKVKIVYHNAVSEGGAGLYTQHCLCSGQYFKGSVIADGSLMRKIYPLFESKTISFGRSKSAQYSRCKIIPDKIEKVFSDKIELAEGNVTAYVCESDIVLTNSCGVFTTDIADLLKNMGLSQDIKLRRETSLTTRVVSGYNAKWNLKKPQIPVICAGSVIVFDVTESMSVDSVMYIGEKLNEGFGKVRVIPDVAALSITDAETEPCKVTCESINENSLIAEIQLRKFDDKIIERAIFNCQKLRIEDKKSALNASQIGRLLLMCKQSSDHNDFIERVNSIKTDQVRDTALNLFGSSAIEKVLSDLFGESLFVALESKNPALRWVKQKKYIITFLTVAKYRLKETVK